MYRKLAASLVFDRDVSTARLAPPHGSFVGQVDLDPIVRQPDGLPRTRIERVVSEQTGITADTALRLAKALDTTAELWLNLLTDYDVRIARRDLGKTLDRIETVNKPPAA